MARMGRQHESVRGLAELWLYQRSGFKSACAPADVGRRLLRFGDLIRPPVAPTGVCGSAAGAGAVAESAWKGGN